MYTDDFIDELIKCRKEIIDSPGKLKKDRGNFKSDFTLKSAVNQMLGGVKPVVISQIGLSWVYPPPACPTRADSRSRFASKTPQNPTAACSLHFGGHLVYKKESINQMFSLESRVKNEILSLFWPLRRPARCFLSSPPGVGKPTKWPFSSPGAQVPIKRSSLFTY